MSLRSSSTKSSATSEPISFTLKPRNRKVRLSATHVTATPDETQYALCQRIAQIAHLNMSRLRVTVEGSGTVVDARVHTENPPKVADIQTENLILLVKDLGPQVSWRLVYVIEYFGPIFFHAMFYYCQSLFYGRTFEHSKMQQLTLAMVELHFLKRELETIFIHRFSADTIPALYCVRNAAHYWALSGLIFGYIVYHPYYSHVTRTETQTLLTLGMYTYAELSNLYAHVTLMKLRPAGTRVRQIPRGYGFDWPFGGISCANYFFEVMAWVTVGLWSWCFGIIPFIVVGTWIMDRWAQQKHRRYRREFPDYPRRAAMFPFIR